MSIDARAIASWGMFPETLVRTRAPFGVSWGLRGTLSQPVSLHHIQTALFSIKGKSAQVSFASKIMQFGSLKFKTVQFAIG